MGDDRIGISAADFGGGLPIGSLDPSRLAFGAATGSQGQLVDTASTGALNWDSDGAGGAATIALATLSNRPTLSASDFVVLP